MKVTEMNPYTVMERFPAHQRAIKDLYNNNQNFQTLCADYRLCSTALDHWSKSDLPEAPQRRKEYETLRSELESKILKNIEPMEIMSWKSKE